MNHSLADPTTKIFMVMNSLEMVLDVLEGCCVPFWAWGAAWLAGARLLWLWSVAASIYFISKIYPPNWLMQI